MWSGTAPTLKIRPVTRNTVASTSAAGATGAAGGQTGGIDYSLGATLTRPAFRHPDAQLSYGVLLEREDEPTYLSDRFHIFAGVERILDDKTTVTGEIGFRAARTKDPFGTRNFRHVLLNAGGVWDNRDSTTNPTTGAYVEIDLMPFIGVSGSASGVRATTDVRGYLPLGDSVVLAGRTQLGSLMGASIASTPPDLSLSIASRKSAVSVAPAK